MEVPSAVIPLISSILVILTKIVANNSQGLIKLKRLILPNELLSSSSLTEEQLNTNSINSGNLTNYYQQYHMDPPIDVLLNDDSRVIKILISLMTSINTNVKRYAAELLYLLCDENTDKFVKMTGFGNAVALLTIRNLL